MVQSDSILIAACRRGDADAWEALVMRYQRLIYSIPSRAGLDEQDAAEVFQAVFARLYDHLHKLEQPDRVQAWLVTTARRETWRVSRQRAATVRMLGTDDEEVQELPADLPLPHEALQRLEDQHLVRLALEQLDAKCRRLLTLLYFGETPLSYEAAAAAIGAPVGSIGPTRGRCLQKLRGLLERAGF
jgi:RNA polymerase sigma factor (sigma-70 family)